MAEAAALSIPPALSQILQDVARRHGLQKPRLSAEPGSGAGDGYSSTVYRISITDESDPVADTNSLTVICKTSMPIFGNTMSKMYEIEAYTYDKLLPAFEAVAKLKNPLPWPRCLHTDVHGPPPHTMVLVDMRPEGYAMADRSHFMDAEHCRLAMKQLARFHGAGFALKHLRPDAFEEFKKSLDLNIWDTPELRDNQKPVNDAMLTVPDVVKGKFPEGSDVYKRLKKMFESFKEDSVSLMGPINGDGYTIIHNDLHVNNMMFQYDRKSGAVTDCRLIDFQMSVYGPPARDIVTVLLVCTDKNMRDQHWHRLLQDYYEELLATMKGAGLSNPEELFPWTLLQEQMKVSSVYGLCMTPLYYIALFADAETVNKYRAMMANISKGMECSFELPMNPTQQGRLEDLVQDLLDWGYLPTVAEIETQVEAYRAEIKCTEAKN